ncbi:type III toxin-antitoxin system TenpIN family toxin [Acinetobacter baumannii]|uniref:type III toxin-antitoxin system TenpIN family toxin n=1 Tax=Acinetobacter baumannii TaxID=470 RepID=UPI002222E291|nr:hypothetical protein [Acinetobacter baumannii]MDV7431417.1 hypothetical protein [Acinetobacter baumannii]
MKSSNKLPLKKLTEEFYNNNPNLVEALDGGWSAAAKVRGYGIVVISINSLTFGIPLRSHVRHKQAFFTDITQDPKGATRKGLDFSKAVLIQEDRYLDTASFKIPVNEFDRIQDNHQHIVDKFTKYVEKYMRAVSKSDENILRIYSYSTLKNYHKELGLS